MSEGYFWSGAANALFCASDAGDLRLDPWTLDWQSAPRPADALPVSGPEALLRLKAAPAPGGGAGLLRRVPVGIIGPRSATPWELETAAQMGAALACHGLQLLCGGKTGVMEAACRGCAGAGGLPIGLVPDAEWQAANPYVAIPIATGIGPARNAVLARACVALIAIGGGYGTLSEMALGLQFGRMVLALGDAPAVPGAVRCSSVSEALAHVARRVLGPASAIVS